MFRSFSRPSSGGPPLRFVPLLFLPLICVRWVCIITQYVAVCVCHLCVFGVLVCWWSACELCVFGVLVCWWSACKLTVHKQITNRQKTPNTHRWHIHAATYCVIIETQRTQISGRNSNGTKHSGGPLKMVMKKTETCGGFILTNTFLTFYWF
jgi:hypothetical protein